MRATLLTQIPESGTLEEQHFSVSADRNAWVLFEQSKFQWVGVFGSTESADFTGIASFDADAAQTVLVVAGGQGYVVDVPSRSLVRKTPWDYCYAAMPVIGADLVVCADPWSIWTTSGEGDVYARITDPRHTDMNGGPDRERIAWDAIILDDLDETTVTGRLEELEGWYEFRLSLTTMTVERGRQITGIEAGIQADYARGYPPNEAARERSASYAL
ncbi:MAG: hypothetical protein ABR543_10305 [Gemmatimonadaceae bacterium]